MSSAATCAKSGDALVIRTRLALLTIVAGISPPLARSSQSCRPSQHATILKMIIRQRSIPVQITDEGLALIKRFEGFRPRAYRCPADLDDPAMAIQPAPDRQPVSAGMALHQPWPRTFCAATWNILRSGSHVADPESWMTGNSRHW